MTRQYGRNTPKKRSSPGIKRAWGRKVTDDPRDVEYPVRRKRSLRTSRYWRDNRWTGDQGDGSSCVGFAWSAWLSCVPIAQWIDPRGIYALARYLDEWPGESDDGTSVRAGAKVLSLLGFLGEYQWAWKLADMIPSLLEVGPVVVGLNWYDDMTTPTKSGRIAATGSLLGGHATLVTGCNVNTKLVRIKNSWGSNWGKKGHAFLSFDDLDKLLREEGEACLGIEHRPKG